MTKKELPSLALVMCVRDEESFIGANLTYHHALGGSRAYIFADRCQDRTIEIAASFPWVTVFKKKIYFFRAPVEFSELNQSNQ